MRDMSGKPETGAGDLPSAGEGRAQAAEAETGPPDCFRRAYRPCRRRFLARRFDRRASCGVPRHDNRRGGAELYSRTQRRRGPDDSRTPLLVIIYAVIASLAASAAAVELAQRSDLGDSRIWVGTLSGLIAAILMSM